MSPILLLQMTANELTDEQKNVTICCDEISLKVHMYYDRNFDKIFGLEDYGDENRSSKTATCLILS